jgi:hypothetical protein
MSVLNDSEENRLFSWALHSLRQAGGWDGLTPAEKFFFGTKEVYERMTQRMEEAVKEYKT